MNRDDLESLLQRADRAAGPPPAGPADLADRVRRLARRRHRTRVVVRAAVAAVVVAGLGLAVHSAAVRNEPSELTTAQQPTPPDPASNEEVARLRSEIAQLRQEANALAEQIRGMTAIQEQRQRLDQLEQAVARLESGEEVRGEMERAAFTIVYQADRMYRELGLRDSAVEAYREAVKLFPDTPSAEIARTRLIEIDRQGEQL